MNKISDLESAFLIVYPVAAKCGCTESDTRELLEEIKKIQDVCNISAIEASQALRVWLKREKHL